MPQEEAGRDEESAAAFRIQSVELSRGGVALLYGDSIEDCRLGGSVPGGRGQPSSRRDSEETSVTIRDRLLRCWLAELLGTRTGSMDKDFMATLEGR